MIIGINYRVLLKGILKIINYKVWVGVDIVFFKSFIIDFDVNFLLRMFGIFFFRRYVCYMKL